MTQPLPPSGGGTTSGGDTTSLWWVYLLHSTAPGCSNRTYIGVTKDLHRRLRQHNGEICGGAKYTCGFRPWRLHSVIGPFSCKRKVLSVEWHAKHWRRRRPTRGVDQRVIRMRELSEEHGVGWHPAAEVLSKEAR